MILIALGKDRITCFLVLMADLGIEGLPRQMETSHCNSFVKESDLYLPPLDREIGPFWTPHLVPGLCYNLITASGH